MEAMWKKVSGKKIFEHPRLTLTEDISSHWTEVDKLNEMIKQGEIVNYATLAAWAFFMQL